MDNVIKFPVSGPTDYQLTLRRSLYDGLASRMEKHLKPYSDAYGDDTASIIRSGVVEVLDSVLTKELLGAFEKRVSKVFDESELAPFFEETLDAVFSRMPPAFYLINQEINRG
jgi:hypothetical protein